MITIKNLSTHPSVRLVSNAPYVLSAHPKTGREIKVADLSNKDLSEPTIEAYLAAYSMETYPANTGVNPKVVEVEAQTIVEEFEDLVITRSIGGITVVEGLPEVEEGTIYITSIVVAKAAANRSFVSPDTIADPISGFAIGAIGYLAFG